jgi:hypothetical protein
VPLKREVLSNIGEESKESEGLNPSVSFRLAELANPEESTI